MNLPFNKPPRRCLLLCGPRNWSYPLALGHCTDQSLWVGDAAPEGIQSTTNPEIRHWLGRELSLVIYDAWQGLDPDALAAICGCIRGGGALLLLTPELSQWPTWPDPYLARIDSGSEVAFSGFLQRLATLLKSAAEVEVHRPDGSVPNPISGPCSPAEEGQHWSLTQDQTQGLAMILRLARGRAHRPFLITADRGRGKSSLLGHAAAALLRQGLGPILVTAAHPQMLWSLFAETGRCLSDTEHQGHELRWQNQSLRFVPADELLRNPQECRLLLVDEAAALPLPLLEQLIAGYPRLVLASTTQGYEGSGRGFVLRLGQHLEQHYPQWHQLELHTPVRWAKNDPLERLLYRLLLLDAEPAPPPAAPGSVRIVQLDQAQLGADVSLLRQVFGLLRSTHYQTRPADLRRLLDQSGLSILALLEGEVVIGLLLAISEGGFDPELAGQIALGLRRPRGHLLPQSLSTHAGLVDAASFRYLRISRIAIHPERQRQGLGSRLLQECLTIAQGHDFLGASFAASPGLIAFWYRNGYLPVRLGYRREAASGQHSLQLLRPLSTQARAVFPAWRRRFDEQFPYLLGDPLRTLSPAIAALLLYPEGQAPELSGQDRADLLAFCQGRRDYGGARLALWRLLCLRAHRVNAETSEALILKVLEARDWQETARYLGLAGQKAVMQRLRTDAAALFQLCGPY